MSFKLTDCEFQINRLLLIRIGFHSWPISLPIWQQNWLLVWEKIREKPFDFIEVTHTIDCYNLSRLCWLQFHGVCGVWLPCFNWKYDFRELIMCPLTPIWYLITFEIWISVAVCLHHQWRRVDSSSKRLRQVSIFRIRECSFEACHVQMEKVLPEADQEEVEWYVQVGGRP